MPEATFVVQLDDIHGFVVRQRHPTTLTLNEKTLNLLFYEQQKAQKEELSFSEIDGLKFVSYTSSDFPGWMVCSLLGPDEVFDELRPELAGSGRLILALMKEDPDAVKLSEILESGKVLTGLTDEQKLAEIYLTPSSALLLERMQDEGVEKAAKLSIWLKNQVQSDDVDIRQAMDPLMRSGIVKVELVGRTSETVFLIKDIFGYRAPPTESVLKAEESHPSIASKYREYITEFFSPPPPSKGYNPTLPVEDPTSPILEDREKISRILSDRLQFLVLDCLRREPLTATEISQRTALPESIVMKVLWALEAEKVAVRFEEEDLWALLTNPRIESFMPEYVLPIIKRKMSEKEITSDAARRYLELLAENWGEHSD
ncbi:MAG: hypothetical protein ACP6KW_03410 [Candidatus Thorarchaeota archaeon]